MVYIIEKPRISSFRNPKNLKLKRAFKIYGYYREGPFDDQNLCFNIRAIFTLKNDLIFYLKITHIMYLDDFYVFTHF